MRRPRLACLAALSNFSHLLDSVFLCLFAISAIEDEKTLPYVRRMQPYIE